MALTTHKAERGGLLTLIFAALLWMTAGTVAAEESSDTSGDEGRTEAARALFREGVELSDAGEWADAASTFERALDLHDAPAIRYNLAVAYSELGRRAAAMEQLDRAQETDDLFWRLRGGIEALVSELEDEVGSLEISGDVLDEGMTITIDGVETEDRAHPFRVEPGHHVVAALVDGEEIARVEVDVAAGGTTGAHLERRESPVEEAIETAVENVPSEAADERPLVRDWRLWVGVGAGVVAILTAIVIGVAVSNDEETRIEDPIFGNMDPGVLTWH